MSAGNAAIVSARKAKQQLMEVAVDVLGCAENELELVAGEIRSKTDPSVSASIGQLTAKHLWRHGGEGIQTLATWDPNTVMHDEDLYGNVAPAHSFAAQTVEVEVDTETGEVRVVDSHLADDCGKAFNPIAIHGQSNGAVVQAIGWTLYEQLQLEDGRIMNGNFADYTMPVAEAVPSINSDIVESQDPNGPYGAKGASETAILTGAAAIANAIHDAVGVRMTELCITPEKVLAALEAKQEAEHA